jgi:hypothetical protein
MKNIIKFSIYMVILMPVTSCNYFAPPKDTVAIDTCVKKCEAASPCKIEADGTKTCPTDQDKCKSGCM